MGHHRDTKAWSGASESGDSTLTSPDLGLLLVLRAMPDLLTKWLLFLSKYHTCMHTHTQMVHTLLPLPGSKWPW